MKEWKLHAMLLCWVVAGLFVISSCSTPTKHVSQSCDRYEGQTESGFYNRGLVLSCEDKQLEARAAFKKSCQSGHSFACKKLESITL